MSGTVEIFEELFNRAPDLMFLVSFDGSLIDVNQCAVDRLGYTRDELLSMTTFDLDTGMSQVLQDTLLNELMDQDHIRFDAVISTCDQELFPVEIVSRIIRFNDQKVVFSIARDTTVRKRTQKLLEVKNHTLQEAEKLAHVGSFVINMLTNECIASDEWCRIHGVTNRRLTVTELSDIAHPEDHPRISKAMHDAQSTMNPFDLTHRIIRRNDGKIRFVRARGRRIVNDQGEDHFYCTSQDVTSEMELLDQLYASEKLFRDLFNKLPEGLLMTQSYHEPFTMVNDTACRMLGYTQHELLKLTPKDIHPSSVDKETEAHFLDQTITEKTVSDHPVLKKDGTVFPVDINTVSLTIEGTPYQVGVFRDVSERSQADENRRLLSSAIGQVPESIVITDSKGKIKFVNSSFEKTTGFSEEEALGNDLLFLLTSDSADKHSDAIKNMLSKRMVWAGRLVSKHKSDREITEDATISPVLNANNELIGWISVRRDVTEELFKEKLQRQSQKLEALGRLAGGIAHDFNNVLQSVIGFAELVHRQLNTKQITEQSQEYTEEIIKAGRRASELIKQILLFSRQKEQEMKPLMMSILLKEAIKLLRSALPSNVKIVQRIDNHVPRVVVDPVQIHQLLTNLGTNAWEAMDETGGTIFFTVSGVNLSDSECRLWSGLTAGQYTRIDIEDTGKGIEPATLERIFEPYFTTKANSGGSGLGLAVVHGIVKAHGGDIRVVRSDSTGTLISIVFPAFLEEKTRTKKPLTLKETLYRGNEHLLIVDDDVSILNYLRILLKRYGYRVTEMSSSSKALSLFLETPEIFDAVIADVTMPQMSGFEMLAQMRKIRPELPTILCTGYSQTIDRATAEKQGIDRFMYKPVDPASMLKTLRVLLDNDLKGNSDD